MQANRDPQHSPVVSSVPACFPPPCPLCDTLVLTNQPFLLLLHFCLLSPALSPHLFSSLSSPLLPAPFAFLCNPLDQKCPASGGLASNAQLSLVPPSPHTPQAAKTGTYRSPPPPHPVLTSSKAVSRGPTQPQVLPTTLLKLDSSHPDGYPGPRQPIPAQKRGRHAIKLSTVHLLWKEPCLAYK